MFIGIFIKHIFFIISLTGRETHGCGIAQTPAGPELVVTGGGFNITTTEIYNFASNTWRYGPSLPHHITGPASVQFGDSFLVVGGENYIEIAPQDWDAVILDTIYQYDTKTEEFVLRDESMSVKAYAMGAVMVTEDVVNCY